MRYLSFFSQYLSDLKPDTTQQKVQCPFKDHIDDDPSFSVNLEKGIFQCFGCGKQGDIFKFYMLWHGVDFKRAKYEILGDATVGILSDSEVEEAHKTLLENSYLIKALNFNRGWLLSTIEQFRLGWNAKEQRVYIPIYNENDELLNIRKYDVFHKSKNKFMGIKGHNKPYIFPIKNLLRDDVDFVTLFAGEPDTILACQWEIIAITFTGGEGVFNRNLLPLFDKKIVYICYDRDWAGMRGLYSIGDELLKWAKEIKMIELPFDLGG